MISIPQAIKSKYANMYIAGTADPEGDYQLDVDVSGLIFSHHPLFSREHVLGARLAQLYDQYLTRQHNNLTGTLDWQGNVTNNKRPYIFFLKGDIQCPFYHKLIWFLGVLMKCL